MPSPNATTRIKTGFDRQTTTTEVIDGIRLDGKSAIVTGASSGLGVETARALAAVGASVTVAARDRAAAEATVAAIRSDTGNAAVTAVVLDLTDRRSIDALIRGWDKPLDILVNNAGVMALRDRTLSPGGHEMQFATNHLGHFALSVGLHDALASAPDGARIVSVSSRGHLMSPIIWDDLNFDFLTYDPLAAYGQSKTANVLFAIEANRRWSDGRVHVNAVHPGAIMTNLARHMDQELVDSIGRSYTPNLKTVEQGAATAVLLAVSPSLAGVGGRYFEDCNEAEVISVPPPNKAGGVAPYALDVGNAERLWDMSLEMLEHNALV